MRTLKNTNGFTLIEVMIAIVVSGIGIIALYAMQTAATRGNSAAFSQTRVTVLANNQIERLIRQPWTGSADLTVGAIHALNLDQYLNETANPAEAMYRLRWRVLDNDPLENVKRIDMRGYDLNPGSGGAIKTMDDFDGTFGDHPMVVLTYHYYRF